MDLFKALFSLVLLGALPASAAQWDCTFQTECIEGEDCADTAYNLTLTAPDGGAAQAEDVTGVFEMTALLSGDSWAGVSVMGTHLLTPKGDRARYSIHMPDADMSILYIGRCTETS